ncbi:ABC transporter membrane-spanning protein [Deinococcus rubellus]
MLRRERLALPLWLLAFPLVMVANLMSTHKLYATPEALAALAAQINGSPAEVALYGQVWTPTLAGLAEWKLSGTLGVLAGLLNLLLVTRHTRGEEEDGRSELLLSGAVGRSVPLGAALLLVLGVNALLALLLFTAQVSQGLEAGGALALSLGVAGNGLVFAGAGALLSQVFPNARTVNLLGGGLLGLAFALRVLGNAGAAALGWLSPLTWGHALRPFADERWSVLLLFVLLSAVLMALAVGLNRRRDLGAGLLPARLGPAQASAGLGGLWALAWRTQRGLIWFWTVALGLLGALLGGVAVSAAGQIPLGQVFAAQGAGPLPPATDILLTLSLVIFGGLVPAALALQLALRPRREEVSGLAETLLSLPVARQRWLAPHLTLMLLGPALALSAFALAAGLTGGDNWTHMQRLWLAALAYLPAVWLLGAAALALFGWWPHLAGLSWVLLGLTALAEVLGDLHVFGAALTLSPFAYVPKLLLGEQPGAALWTELALATALIGATFAGLRRRDVRE